MSKSRYFRGPVKGPKRRVCRILDAVAFDNLEQRRLLSAAAFEASLAATRVALTGLGADGITIISHGHRPTDDGGDELLALAQAVQAAEGGALVNFDATAAGGSGAFTTTLTAGTHVTLLYDWAPQSNESAPGFAEGAGDALFGMLVGLGLVSPQEAVKSVGGLHFIGDGSGAVVVSEAVERLASYGVPVAHLTYLDPHDFDAPNDATDDGQLLATLGSPLGYGAAVWSNVGFADVYYQTSAAPVGRPIPGAYNVKVGSGTADAAYLATIPNSATASNGYGFEAQPSNRPTGSLADNFYSNNQDHTYSDPNLVSLTFTFSGTTQWKPNQTGLNRLHLMDDEVAEGGWSPDYFRGSIYNGFFDLVGSNGQIPGWAGVGGESAGVVQEGGAAVSPGQKLSHGITYIPGAVHALEYQLKVVAGGTGELVVRIGDVEIERVALTTAGGFKKRVPVIPAGLIGSAHSISFAVEGGIGSTAPLAIIDGVRFGNPDGVSVVPVVDRSGSMTGQKIEDAKTAATLFVQLLSDDDRVGIVSFQTTATTNFSLTQITAGPPDTRSDAAAAISLITAGGTTAIGQGLLAANTELASATGSRAIVLLSDGMENVSPYVRTILPSIAPDIRIYTIGLGDGADEALLIDIAQQTGGRYQFGADSGDLQQIYSEILADVTGAQTLTRTSSTVNPGATANGTVPISPGTTAVSFGINWGGSDLDLSLIAPDGTVYSEATLASLPNVERVEGASYEFLRITSPIPGVWQTRVTAVDVPGSDYPFDLYAIGATSKQVNLSTGVQQLTTGSVARFTVSAADEFGAIRGGTIAATVKNPDASSLAVMFRDDGTGPDVLANDGVYTAEYRALHTAGVYSISAAFAGTDNSGDALSRTLATTFRATGANVSGARPVLLVNGAVVDLDGGGYTSIGSYFGGTVRPTATFTLRNEGTAPYPLTGISLPSGFSMVQGLSGAVLQPGDERTFTVRFDAAGEGVKSGTVTLSSPNGAEQFGVFGTNSPGVLNVRVADLPVSTLNLGSARIHSHGASTVVTVSNTGGSTIPLGVSVPEGFSAINAPSTLAPGETALVTLLLPATAAGSFDGNVVFTRTDTNVTVLTVPLTATITNGPLAVVTSVTTTSKPRYLTADKKAGGNITALIGNMGNQPLSGDMTLTIQLVSDSGTFNVGSKTVKAKNLAVDKTIKAKVAAKFSNVTVAGDYEIRATIHGSGVLDAEYARGSAGSVALEPTKVKLLVSPPLGLSGKGTLSLPISANNSGNATATGYLLADVLLLPEGINDELQGLVLGNGLRLKSNIKVGGQQKLTLKVKLPETVSPGAYVMVVKLSGDGLAASDVEISPAEVRVAVTVG